MYMKGMIFSIELSLTGTEEVKKYAILNKTDNGDQGDDDDDDDGFDREDRDISFIHDDNEKETEVGCVCVCACFVCVCLLDLPKVWSVFKIPDSKPK